MALQKFVVLTTILAQLSDAALIISEVADKGTSDATVCNANGNDWIELFNSGTEAVDLFAGSYILHDDKGYVGTKAEPFYFPQDTVLAADEYMVVCTKQEGGANLSPSFGINGDDTITLATLQGNTYTPIASVILPNTDDAFNVTYSLNPITGLYEYTSTPTPSKANEITPVLTKEEHHIKRKAKLAEQNALGSKFFDMDDKGYPVPDAMDPVLDFHVTMEDYDYQYILKNASFETYRPFQSAKLTARGNEEQELWALNIPGRIRPKGQYSLFSSLCFGSSAFPFQVEFGDRNSKNPFNFNQTLFGVKTIFLRNHGNDNSYARDWVYNRMAARFGLPHLRARQVRFLVNGNLHGLYTLLEAPDEEYVFARSFPDYDPDNFALYKVKTFALSCGNYPHGAVETVEERLYETSTPPYAFERGEHRPIVEVLGTAEDIDKCQQAFYDNIFDSYEDVILAYLRYDQSCPDMLLGEGLIDRDLGTKDWDESMKELVPNMLKGHKEKSDLPNLVDTENVLKSIAFYAVTVNTDSPLGNGNNYYWLQTGADEGERTGKWKMNPYDFNNARVTCNDGVDVLACEDRMVTWSIAQPTCVGLEENPVVGPLLSDPDLFNRYLVYVREFVEIYGNETFHEQVRDQLRAHDADAREDYWSLGGIYRDLEFSQDPSDWKQERPIFPLVPLMKARAQDVRQQLEAIDIGTYPRGPHGVGLAGKYDPLEQCVDWHLEEPDIQEDCPQNCRYEGCHVPGWTVASHCNKDIKVCYHGDWDPMCTGISDLGSYEGIEEIHGQRAFCVSINGIPSRLAACPAPGEVLEDNAVDTEVFRGIELEEEDSLEGLASSSPSFARVGAWTASVISMVLGTLALSFA